MFLMYQQPANTSVSFQNHGFIKYSRLLRCLVNGVSVMNAALACNTISRDNFLIQVAFLCRSLMSSACPAVLHGS